MRPIRRVLLRKEPAQTTGTGFESHRFMVLSTGHISLDASGWLKREALKTANRYHRGVDYWVGATPYGWMLWVPSDPTGWGHYPLSVQNCFSFCLAKGFEYLMFDQDADYISELQVYDW